MPEKISYLSRFCHAERRDQGSLLEKENVKYVREQGAVGSSLQAELQLTVPPDDHALLASLGDELRFVFITSDIELIAGSALLASASASKHQKCERCWHYRADVGHTAEHPTLCGRCVSNLYGAGETRTIA